MADSDLVGRASSQRTAWVLAVIGLMLTVMLLGAVLWVVMPSWFRDLLIAHSPRLDLAYHAAEHDGGDGGLSTELHERFSRKAVLIMAADRLLDGTPAQQEYAARHIGWIFWKRHSFPPFVLDDVELRRRLVELLVAVSRGSNQHSIDAACYALMQMGELQYLPEILRVLDAQPRVRWYSMFSFRQIRDDPLVTTHLLKWFHAHPDQSILRAIMAQNDPRAEDLIISVLRSPSYGPSLRRIPLLEFMTSSASFSAVRQLCADSDYFLRRDAVAVLAATDDGLNWLLDVRLDPKAELSHQFAEDYLRRRADELSIDQGYRWISAPPLAPAYVP